VIRLLTQGLSTNEIAAALHISPLTVRGHLKQCFRKLGVHSRAEAVRAAQAAGMGGK